MEESSNGGFVSLPNFNDLLSSLMSSHCYIVGILKRHLENRVIEKRFT